MNVTARWIFRVVLCSELDEEFVSRQLTYSRADQFGTVTRLTQKKLDAQHSLANEMRQRIDRECHEQGRRSNNAIAGPMRSSIALRNYCGEGD